MTRPKPAARRNEVGQAAVDGAESISGLVGIGQMKLADIPQSGRADRQLIALDQGAINGERQEGVGVADVVVIEEILGQGMEGVEIDGPAVDRDAQAELILLVTLSMKGNESQVVILREFKQRASQGDQRRRLVVLAPKA